MCARMCTHVCVCVCFGGGQGVGGLGGRGGGREDSSMGSDVMVGKPGRQRCGACTTHPAQLLLPHAHTDTRTHTHTSAPASNTAPTHPPTHPPTPTHARTHTCASDISRWKRLRRLATGAPRLKQGRPLSDMSATVAMMGSATVRALFVFKTAAPRFVRVWRRRWRRRCGSGGGGGGVRDTVRSAGGMFNTRAHSHTHTHTGTQAHTHTHTRTRTHTPRALPQRTARYARTTSSSNSMSCGLLRLPPGSSTCVRSACVSFPAQQRRHDTAAAQRVVVSSRLARTGCRRRRRGGGLSRAPTDGWVALQGPD
jgi:hypothetical protein